ncbi:Scd6-like Sm domain-containing protein [Hypoxylon sp. FL1150]|nr:Scd6-like Sm domain-containing protein [Hypoxylon sp. FL1150]
MSEFLGSRISLISKSDIRYSGVLHEISSEDSTVSLENVKSFGTEGRKGNPAEEIAPSDQVYEYIVFRGSDVKDLRIEQAPPLPKENQPPKVPDDPAIVGAGTRPQGAMMPGRGANQGPRGPGYGQSPFQPNHFYPPPPGQWGRGGPGPGPGQGFNGMPYPPPPGWFPPGQGFPGGPGGPGPWNSFGYPPGPGPQGPPVGPGQGMRGTPQQDNKPTPIGAGVGVDKQRLVGAPAVELPTEPKSLGQQPIPSVPTGAAPTPPIESKPTAAEVKATAESLATNSAPNAAEKKAAPPTGPRSNRVTPAVPIPTAIMSRSGPQVTAATASVKPAGDPVNGSTSAASLKDATQAAKAAVAVAMAKLENPAVPQINYRPADSSHRGTTSANPNAGAVMDNLTKKVNEMRMQATGTTSTAGRTTTAGRGRSRAGRPGGVSKVEVPNSDFDFQAGNAKFNKQDLVKEAIAGSPLAESSNVSNLESTQSEDSGVPIAYNKTRSFFDNISSESKDRAENGGQKPGGREWRGEEQRKNMETFGQGSVDGGYRGNYRGRGRARNTRGRSGHSGHGRGRGNGFRQQTTQ